MSSRSVLEAYRHREGKHCESTCQRNLLLAMGVDVEESVLFGLDGAFGLSYFASPGNEVDIIVGKQTLFPLQAARLMGVQVDPHREAGSAPVVRLLEQQQVVLARVDIGQLPYWKLHGKLAFGGYFVNVVGHDPRARTFQISDAAFPEPQTVDAEQFARARASKQSPPVNPENRLYIFNALRGAPKLDKVGPVAVRNICREVLRPDLRNFGLPGIKVLLAAVQQWPETKRGRVMDVDLEGNQVECDALTRQLVYLGRQIERFGTGGGLFRPMLSRFLSEVGAVTGQGLFQEAAETLSQSGRLWSDIGQRLVALGSGGSLNASREIIEPLGEVLQTVSKLEKQVFESLKDC